MVFLIFQRDIISSCKEFQLMIEDYLRVLKNEEELWDYR